MQQYRKKQKQNPPFYAVQWTGENFDEISNFTGNYCGHKVAYEDAEALALKTGEYIFTDANGSMTLKKGYFLIKTDSGYIYSCDGKSFIENNEPVSAPSVLDKKTIEEKAWKVWDVCNQASFYLDKGGVNPYAFVKGYTSGFTDALSCNSVQPRSEGGNIDKLEILKRHYFNYYRSSYPGDERTREVIDMALSIKEETACILAAMDEYKGQSEGGLQWVKEIKKYKEWLQSELSFIESERGMYPRSARIQGRKRAIENCSERFEQIFGSVQPQIESGLRWVNCAKRLHVDWEDDWSLMHLRYAQDHHKLDTDLFEHIDNALIKKNGFARLEYWQIEWLDESASLSTANTEEGAELKKLQDVIKKVLNMIQPHTPNQIYEIRMLLKEAMGEYNGPIEKYNTTIQEQQIAFAEWIRDNCLIDGDPEKMWHKKSGLPQKTIPQLYELFLTETKQQP